jgi:WD40 repeat protein
MQLSIEEAELRALRIPSSLHRGSLSPSKNSFLPTLQEQAQDRAQHLPYKAEARRRRLGGRTGTLSEEDEADEAARQRQLQQLHASHLPPEQQVLSGISAEVLDSVKEDFVERGGSLRLDQFARAMLRHLEGPPTAEELNPRREKAVAFSEIVEAEAVDGSALDPKDKEPDSQSTLTASVIDLFRRVDIHGEGAITWEEVSNYIIEQAMAGQDEFAVDSIKTYESSTTIDQSKHESAVEKLVYLDQIDSMVCLSHNSRHFRLYDPKRCTVRNEVAGHRGTVINCCFVDAFHQIATTGADMTICLWDTTHLGLRNRLSTKEVQLCLQWDNHSKSLFSGSIDGTLSRWDLNGMCLTDAQKGKHKKAINDLLTVSDINLLASASSDGSILMWDTTLMRPKKTFKGHRKGTFSLAYSMDYHCLLTAGLDQEALVWNPYVERVPIFRLKGHTHALCGVAVVPGTPQVLSADVTGTFRLWDMRNFRCVQNFGGSETQVNELNTFCALPRYKRVAAGSSKITLYDYPDEGSGESVTDTAGVTEALYNPRAGEFYTVTKQSVKAWNAASGTVFKVLRDIAPSEITAACLADNGRKLYLGDAKGRVAAHALHNGSLLTEFERHNTDISCLAVWKGTNRLFSSSWDGVVKVHSDEGPRIPQMKAEFQCHRDGVACLACSPELMLLASGGTGTDSQVILYDLKTLKLEHVLARFKNVIAGIDFLSSRCLLAVADQGGLISLWRTRPQPSLGSASPISRT